MRLLTLLAIIGALFYAYNARIIPGLNQPAGAYAEDGSAKILLFTANKCGKLCSTVTGNLHSRRAKFVEINISDPDVDEEHLQLWKELGKGYVPYLVAGEFSNAVTRSTEVAAILAKAFGEKHLSKAEQEQYKTHFNDYGEPIVMIYGADWCPYCKKLNKELTDNGIDFVELDVDKHRSKSRITKTMGITGYPSTWYGFHRVSGIDAKSVKHTIKMASY